MSHFENAPLLKTRQHQQRSKNFQVIDTFSNAQSPLPLEFNDSDSSNSPSSSSSSPSRYRALEPRFVTLKALRLPQIAQRHAKLSPQFGERRDGPKFFNLLPKRAPVAIGGEEVEIDENTNCRDVVREYEGDEDILEVRRNCAKAVRDAIEKSRSEETSRTSTRTVASSTATRRTSNRSRTTPRARQADQVAAESRLARIAAVSLTADPANTAALASNVDQIFSEAYSVVASRSSSRAALVNSVSSIFSDAASVISSRQVAATATTTPSSSSSTLPSSSLAPTTSSLPTQSSSASTSSTAPVTSSSSTPENNSSSDNHRVRNIVVPSVVIPIGLLLIFGLLFFCWRRRKRRRDAGGGYNGQTISGPRPLRLAANYGTSATGGGAAGVGAGSAAMAAAGRGGGGGGRGRNASNESFGTTPSAIGVAVSEPRSKWGRRSLVEAIAGGVMMGSSSGNTNTPSPTRGGMHSRQESLASSLDRGTGGYNSKGGYRPGMPRPFSPVTAQDPFQEAPSIIAVPPPTRRPASLSSGSDQSLYDQSQESNESLTARLARPITSGYPLSTPGVESRTSTEGEQGYWTADAGINSSRERGVGEYFGRGAGGRGGRDDEEEEELSPDDQPPVEPVNFGSGSSNSSGGSTPIVGGNSTPRLGSGHGSRGYRRGDSSWWN